MDRNSNSSFLGRGWGFPPEFALFGGQPTAGSVAQSSGAVANVGASADGAATEFIPTNAAASTRMVAGDRDIRESLWILFSTTPGERVMNPDFGCGLRSRVFDSISENMITEIRDLIERAILFFEPRINLDNVDVILKDPPGGILEIDVSYTIRTTNTRSNMVYPFYFLEGANVPRKPASPAESPGHISHPPGSENP